MSLVNADNIRYDVARVEQMAQDNLSRAVAAFERGNLELAVSKAYGALEALRGLRELETSADSLRTRFER